MISKEQFIGSIMEETRLIKHLFTKLPTGALDYRPSEKQRTTLELLQYVSTIGIASAQAILEGSTAVFADFEARGKAVTADNFAVKMDEQAAGIQALITAISDTELATPLDLWKSGHAIPKSVCFLDMTLKFLTAYRMQLFLYAKAAGADQLSTMNLWAGQDPQPKA